MSGLIKLFIPYFILLLAVIFLPLLFPTHAQEQQRQQRTVVLGKDEVINHDYFQYGDTVTLAGTVNGDTYIAAGTVNIEGTINGDLLTAGGNINIRGKVNGNIRAAGGNIVNSATVEKNTTLLGGNITTTDAAKLLGSLVIAGGNVSVLSPVGKDITAAAGQLSIGNSVTGEVTAAVGTLEVSPLAKITGNISYWSNTPAQIASGSALGKVTQHQPPQPTKVEERPHNIDTTKAAGVLAGMSLGLTIWGFITSLIIGLLLILFAPVFASNTVTVIMKQPLLSLGVGFLTLVSFPILFIILLITIVGIPIAFILLALFCITMYFSHIIVSFVIGQKTLELFNRKLARGWVLVIGLTIFTIVGMIPLVGWLLGFIATLLGLGGIITYKKQLYQELRSKNVI